MSTVEEVKILSKTFKGGIHPDYNKERTFARAIERLPASDKVIIPLRQHIGAACEPLVRKGDYVKLGQPIGESDASISCPVHASVSGTVKAVEPRWNQNGTRELSVVIENDFEDRRFEECFPREKEMKRLSPEDIVEGARRYGIVGMGGAGFPLHAKLRAAIDSKVDTLIINGAECEPYVTCDHRAMIEYPRYIVGGILLIMRCLGLDGAILAIEKNKPDAINSMKITSEDTGITVAELETKYPQGGEKQLVYALTGREIPPGKLPTDIGCAVFNVDTCASLFRGFDTGLPLYQRVVTVSGDAVKKPKNLLTRIGTPYETLFEYCGGFEKEPYKIICGGPMMGLAQHSLEIPVVKNTSALLAFAEGNETIEENPICIRCGKCSRVCPMRLMPNYIFLYGSRGDLRECEKLNATDCIECGCCSYISPGKMHLVQAIRMVKGKLSRR